MQAPDFYIGSRCIWHPAPLNVLLNSHQPSDGSKLPPLDVKSVVMIKENIRWTAVHAPPLAGIQRLEHGSCSLASASLIVLPDCLIQLELLAFRNRAICGSLSCALDSQTGDLGMQMTKLYERSLLQCGIFRFCKVATLLNITSILGNAA